MATLQTPRPLELARRFGVPQRTIAAILDVSVSWLRVLARDPRYARQLRIAELQAILEREREQATLESMLAGNGGGAL